MIYDPVIKVRLVDKIAPFKKLGPEPAFGRLGLGGSSGEYSSHGYTSYASLRAYGVRRSARRGQVL